MVVKPHAVDRKHERYHIIFTHSLERSNHSKLKPYDKKADYLQRLQAEQKFKS